MRIHSLASFFSLLIILSTHTVHAAIPCDATTGASMKVIGIITTPNSAKITWQENRHNGGRMFKYGIGTYGPATSVQSRASNSKIESVTGLTPNSKYMYQFYGVWKGSNRSVVSGTFTTDGSGCGDVVYTKVDVSGVVLSSTGDSLENVQVSVIRNSDGIIVGKDFTDRSGGYAFSVEPGVVSTGTFYSIKCAYSPFTPPPAYGTNVVAGKALEVKDQILSGAFQIGGLVLSAPKGDSIAKASVTITSKTDVNLVYTRETDMEGHFNVGLKAGEYWINAVFGTKTLSSPMSVNVNKSQEISDLILSATVGIKSQVKAGHRVKVPAEAYNVKGVLEKVKSNNQVRWSRELK